MPKFTDAERLSTIREAVNRLEGIRAAGEQDFMHDSNLQDAACWNFFTIGEGANQLSLAFQQAHPNIPWKDYYNYRNFLGHGYMSIDVQILWQTLSRRVPQMKRQLDAIK